MGSESINVKNYLEIVLPPKIIACNDELQNCEIIKCTSTASNSMDGFLSSIFQLCVEVEDKTSKRKQTLNLIAKLMKNVEAFRDEAKLDEMTINELAFYSKIMPYYENFLKGSGCDLETKWAPKFYYGFYGFDKDLGTGENPEGVFVFENLTSDDYRLGPRDKLDEKHIMLMTETIAKLHATSYAVKLQEKEKFDEFVANFKLIPFHTEDKKTMFHPLYDIALERVHRHVTSTDQPEVFRDAYEKVYEKFIAEPSKLLQMFVDDDPVFNIIIHGDYNRNNVMFKYNSPEGFENPTGVKMFDFQWAKFASPVLDLSFYLYMNLDPALFESSWDKILKFYHKTLISSLAKILNCSEKDEILKQFNFDDFIKHFEDHAFYGCVISAWFLPIMLCDMKILPGILEELQKDLFSAKSKEVCLPAGGLETIVRVTENVKHAFKKGYMRCLIE